MIHLLTLDFPPDYDGGIASWCEDLARALVGAGQPVCVYARHTGLSEAYDATLPFPVLRLKGRSWGKYQAVWAALHVGPLVGRGHTLICATWKLAEIIAPLVGRRARVGVFFHGSDLTRLQGTPRGLRRVIASAQGLFPVSTFLAKELQRHGGEGRVLPLPIPHGPPGALGQGLIAVARLNRLKGVDRCIAIAKSLGWHLTVVGDGPARAELEVDAIRSGASVEFVGRKPRVRVLDAYRGKAACLLLPRADEDGSGQEGLGLVLLEGMGQGTPAVGCRTGGVPEAVGPGLILEDPDDAEASAGALRSWLSTGARSGEAHSWLLSNHGAPQAASALLEAMA